MITGRGFSYAVLTVLVYLILSYSGFSLLTDLLLVLLLLPPLSALQLLLAGRRLRFSQKLEYADIERGDQNHLQIQFRQDGLISFGELDLIIRSPGPRGQPAYERHRLPLLAGHPVDLSFAIDCHHRGRFPIGIWSMHSRDLLGIFYLPIRTRRTCRRQLLELSVLPRPETIPDTDVLASLLADWQHQQTPHFGDDVDTVANLRAHRPGDSLKRTHWKVSARLNQIMIKEFENPIQREGLLILDLEPPGQHTVLRPTGLELGDFFMDRAAFLIKMILETGNHLRIVAYQPDGRQEQHAESLTGLRSMQYLLSGLNWAEGWPADQVLMEETGHGQSVWFVLLLTTRLGEATARQLQDLQNRGLLTWVILIDEQPDDPGQTAALAALADQRVPVVIIRRHEDTQHVT